MKKETIKYIIQLIVAILTAIGTTLGVTSCMGKAKHQEPHPQHQKEVPQHLFHEEKGVDTTTIYELSNPEDYGFID